EIRQMLGLTEADLDRVVFRDSQSFGEPGLRNAITRRWANGDAERIMVTHGSSEAMFLLMHALLRAGDEVIVIDPAYQPLFAIAGLVYEQPPLPDPASRYERAISLGTLSKAYGLPGLRVGWCIASPEVLSQCIHLRDYMTLYMSPLIEVIARAAIENADRLLD